MDNYAYYKEKIKTNINIYIIGYVILILLVDLLILRKHIANGVYTSVDALMINLIFGVYLLYTVIVVKIAAVLAMKSEGQFIVAIIFTIAMSCAPLVLAILPARRYHGGYGPDEVQLERIERKVFRATIRAYQRTWREQNFFARAVLPLIILGITVLIYQLFSLLYNWNDQVFAWVMFGILLMLALVMLGALGGIRDVRVTTTEYSARVGTGWLDYGEVYVTEGESKTRDETKISFVGLILCFIATPFLLVAAFLLIGAWVALDILFIILPLNSRFTVYMRKKTAIHMYYVPGPDIFKRGMVVINRFMRAIFRLSFVNRAFWEDGVGQRYIESYLSPRKKRKLQKRLNRVAKRFGYLYR